MAVKKRSELDPAYCWDLEAMYADDDIWERDFSVVSQETEEFRSFCGKMQEGPESLLKILKSRENMERKAEHLYVYANMRWHQDTANGKYQAMAGKSAQLLTQVNDAQAFVEPEILALTEQQVQKYMDSCPGLKLYKRFFSEIFRGKEHVLTPDMEALLARAQDMANAPQQIFMNFNNADLAFGEIQDESGKPVTVTHGNYTVLLKNRDRRVREDAFRTMYGAYEAHKNTLAATMDANTNMMMVGHVILSKIDKSVPASFSRTIMSDLIRKELGFEGVLFTEALNLPVITNQYTPEEAEIKALIAGADMLYNPVDLEEAIFHVSRAVMSGDISEKQIDQVVLRILQDKIQQGIYQYKTN